MLEDSGISLIDLMQVYDYLTTAPATDDESADAGSNAQLSLLNRATDSPAMLLRQYQQTLAAWLLMGGIDVEYSKWGGKRGILISSLAYVLTLLRTKIGIINVRLGRIGSTCQLFLSDLCFFPCILENLTRIKGKGSLFRLSSLGCSYFAELGIENKVVIDDFVIVCLHNKM